MSRSLIILPVLLILLFCSAKGIAQNRQVFQKLDSILMENEFNYRTHHLSLHPGITWLSFPRLMRHQNLTPDEVLGGNISLPIYQTGSELRTFINNNEQTNIYSSGYWPSTPITIIESNKGYKLDFKDEYERTLFMTGTLPEHSTPESDITLYGGYDNWVGYFLPQSQQVFDIIPDNVLEDIIEIKHQDWAVYNTQLPGPPAPDGTCPGGWKCGENVQLLVRYGDMLIIRTNTDHVFQWLPYTRSEQDQSQEAGYFTYEEEPDYTAVFIELDTTNNPLEIGAFVNDSCIGAASVGQDDSLVQLRAYTDTSNMGELVFEEYYGLKSTSKKIKDYLVADPQSGKFHQRKIHTGERQAYYTVSFRKDKKTAGQIPQQQDFQLECLPNPVSGTSKIRYILKEDAYVSLKVYDLYGRTQALLHEGNSPAGTYDINWNATGPNGMALPAGVYIVRLETANKQAQVKVLVIGSR